MEIGDWRATRDLNGLYRQIRALGLETNLAELDAFGFTVIENALTPELTTALRSAVLRQAEQTFAQALDVEAETEHRNWKLVPYLMFKDRVFEEAVLNEKPLALITWLLGQSCRLSSLTSHVKGPGGPGLLLHSDTSNGAPAPFSPFSIVANCNYALTDYTEAGGALAMVPGSHRHCRQPTRYEVGLDGEARNPDAIPIEVPAGSAIVWHGNTWHGSFPRKQPGLRINLSMYFCRQHIEPQEDYKNHVPDELIARHGRDSRLATLLGLHSVHGWTDEGPQFTERSSRVGRTWHA
ncbi:MAG TPA: phytanoyl-CoA dioxygenase family protein [Caulobacteraceae bacterium]|nr:phytanoyl-CoA dioxygenase family protein [Caulobacteraceae bacterium]